MNEHLGIIIAGALVAFLTAALCVGDWMGREGQTMVVTFNRTMALPGGRAGVGDESRRQPESRPTTASAQRAAR